MKLLRSTLFWCVVTLCITLLVFTFLRVIRCAN